jgi:hypothetical protein
MSHMTKLRIRLLSATTFGSGEGLPGLVDRELVKDADGFPCLKGKTLTGLLAEEAECLVFLLRKQDNGEKWTGVKKQLFGVGGSTRESHAKMKVSDARLPENVRILLRDQIRRGNLTLDEVFNSLTGIRRQTAMNEYGAPEHSTLRSLRVVQKGVFFEAPLEFEEELDEKQWAFLTAVVLALRHAGTARNRGRGWVMAELEDSQKTQKYYEAFCQEVRS